MRAAAVFFAGLVLSAAAASAKPVWLAILPAAERIVVRSTGGPAPPVGVIEDSVQVARLEAFVDSLPPKWKTPWFGPPVGRVYFDFYRNGKLVGNFYVGPNFFGRDMFAPEDAEFLSQEASQAQVDQLSRIAGFDLWKFIHAKTP
jgi:hypothetical protein